MLYVDIPSAEDFRTLNETRADACVSIYLRTSPLTQEADASRIELRNLAKEARRQLEADGFDKRRLADLMKPLEALGDDEAFWRFQANSLAIFATPDEVRHYRLANKLSSFVEVADRFFIKPLLRSLTFSHSAFVLALSENAVRLVEVNADLPARTVKVAGLPKSAADAVGQSTLNDRAPHQRIQGSEGQNVRYEQYARQIDKALHPVLANSGFPLVLAGTERLISIYRTVNSYSHLLPDEIRESPDHTSDAKLAEQARPILDAAHQREIGELKALYQKRLGERRATSDLAAASQAATAGAIEIMLVNIDSLVPGSVDETTGTIQFAEDNDAQAYGIVDEIAGRALSTGARVLGVRQTDLPAGGELAAILRYPY